MRAGSSSKVSTNTIVTRHSQKPTSEARSWVAGILCCSIYETARCEGEMISRIGRA
jgi:hypothetical protein